MTNKDQFDPSRHGIVAELPDGRVTVSFERTLKHPIEKIWQAISDPDSLADWFPEIRVDHANGTFQIWFGGDCDGPPHVEGALRAEPPHLLIMGSMKYELTEINDGTLLKFTDILVFTGNRSRQEIALAVLGGWHAFMDRLCLALDEKYDGKQIPEPDYSRIEVPGWNIL